MELLRPIFWGQGMFLQPQHFQQQDGYHEARLHRYMHWISPFYWGLKSLLIRETIMGLPPKAGQPVVDRVL